MRIRDSIMREQKLEIRYLDQQGHNGTRVILYSRNWLIKSRLQTPIGVHTEINFGNRNPASIAHL
jgi:hypothetical protein